MVLRDIILVQRGMKLVRADDHMVFNTWDTQAAFNMALGQKGSVSWV